ncbi:MULTISPECIES: hypothetical protein [Microbacterium]|uniref:Inorganic diphosphatase n=1 Tax=Microbacterium wangchenii TaxID=2541726 RepID=A0ABX5SXP6_9MICO|nr:MULTISPECIES: hypothetical protein [Microbacterium]MCK6068471.1 hypothetical protein [Microbacterium sp. EYE_512]QBR90025.1 hypothetical protein E4K62_15820 [Microbacterium wangchenii]TFV85124.1 hypothetical protein E4V99_08940 [Microbacterium sp. dk485]TXK09255.1 hypothetical protein FVP99_17980 [Microbacterium wangchenii]
MSKPAWSTAHARASPPGFRGGGIPDGVLFILEQRTTDLAFSDVILPADGVLDDGVVILS